MSITPCHSCCLVFPSISLQLVASRSSHSLHFFWKGDRLKWTAPSVLRERHDCGHADIEIVDKSEPARVKMVPHQHIDYVDEVKSRPSRAADAHVDNSSIEKGLSNCWEN